jgi:hypothetical protein
MTKPDCLEHLCGRVEVGERGWGYFVKILAYVLCYEQMVAGW